MKNISKSVICIIFSLTLLLVFCISSYATAYPNEFPSNKTGITGGCFIIAHIGNQEVTIVLPVSYRDRCLSFATNGELFNITNSTISGKMYVNNDIYSVRWQGWSTAEYYHLNGQYYTWSACTIANVTDTNVIFDTVKSEWQNDSIYLDKKDVMFASILISILFFVFLGWFLWHKER